MNFPTKRKDFSVSRTFLRETSLGVYLGLDFLVVECREKEVGMLEFVVWSIAFRVSGHEWKEGLPERKGQHLHGVE